MAVNDGAMRASDRDRETTVQVLRDAFVDGRLDLAELGDRAGAAYRARTWADLCGLTDDLLTRPGLPVLGKLQAPGWSRAMLVSAPGWLVAPILLIVLAVAALAAAAWASAAAIPLLVLSLSLLSAAGCSALSAVWPDGAASGRPGSAGPGR